jgi:hypothetical protein
VTVTVTVIITLTVTVNLVTSPVPRLERDESKQRTPIFPYVNLYKKEDETVPFDSTLSRLLYALFDCRNGSTTRRNSALARVAFRVRSW